MSETSKVCYRMIYDDANLMTGFTRVFRALRPQWPDAEVFMVDSGAPGEPNVTMQATTSEGVQTVMVCHEVYVEIWNRVNP